MRLLEAHPLTSNAVFGACVDEEDALGTFYELFGKVFTAFARHHREAIQAFVSQGGVPQMAVMQYNSIHRGFFEGLGRGTLVQEWSQRSHCRATARSQPPLGGPSGYLGPCA